MYRRSCPSHAPDALEEGNSSAETGTSFQAMQAPILPGLARPAGEEGREGDGWRPVLDWNPPLLGHHCRAWG